MLKLLFNLIFAGFLIVSLPIIADKLPDGKSAKTTASAYQKVIKSSAARAVSELKRHINTAH